MRGKRGIFSLFTSLPEHPEEKPETFTSRRRRRHSSGDRETWSRKVENIFAGLGYAVGLGNIWRFPYLCYRNGGGAFLIPYVIVLIAAGFPMVFLEMSFGQFASLGPITIWRVCPLFKGIGYAIVTVLLLVNTYYNVLIAYSLYYLFASITDELPWSHCNNNWNTENCIPNDKDVVSNSTELLTTTTTLMTNFTNSTVSARILKTPTEEFFERHLLRMSEGIDDLGSVQWPLIVCLCVSWFICFVCLFKGIKSMGKAVIFTTIFSYGILTVLLIRGVTLPGAVDGLVFYLKPRWEKLGHLQVWGEASAQVFASLSLGGGGWITLSSYNKFNNKCNRDAILVGIGNALTSIYSGFVIFSVLGFMAFKKGTDVGEVTDVGPGLAFVAYPEGLAMIPGAPFWAICFFFMMFTVGLDSLFGQVETLVASVIDEYPDVLRPHRRMITGCLCILMFFIGIPLVTQGGIFIVTLMDWYTLLFSFTIISFCEVIVIIYIYGYKKFCNDIQLMIGVRPNYYYMATWLVIAPVTMICVITFLGIKPMPAYYGAYMFPPQAESIGWALAFVPISLIPLTMIVQFFISVGSFTKFKKLFSDQFTRKDVLYQLISPTEDWGPALPENRRRYSSSSSQRKHHPSGDNLGDDDVFGNNGAELTSIKPRDPEGASTEKDRLVHFEDEKAKQPESEKIETKDEPEKVDEDKENVVTTEKGDNMNV